MSLLNEQQKDYDIQLQQQHANMLESIMHLRADMPRIVVNTHEPYSICISSRACRQHWVTAYCHHAHRLLMST